MSLTETTFYKIRHKKTGLFSKGGVYVNAEGNNIFWNKNGKTWDNIGTLRSHITAHLPSSYGKGTDMTDWEVVEFKCVPTDIKPIHEIVKPEKIIQLLKQ